MKRAPRQPDRVRNWPWVGLLIGLGSGAVLHGSLGLESRTTLVATSLVAAAVGYLAARLLLRTQREPASADEPAPEPTGDSAVAQRTVFYALPGTQSSSRLRSLRVSQPADSSAPVALDLRVVIEEFDVTHRLPVVEGVLGRLSAREVLDRVRAAIDQRLPTTRTPAQLELVWYRSEGPVDVEGCCRWGWTFELVDGRLGLACTATATRREVALWFHSVVTWVEPTQRDWVDPAVVAAGLWRAVPEAAEAGLALRIDLPDTVLAFAPGEPALLALSPDGTLISRARPQGRTRAPRTSIAAIQAWFRAGDVDPGDALADFVEADALRTLSSAALRRVAQALTNALGPETCLTLYERMIESDDAEFQRELLHVLAHVPSGLAMPTLQRTAAVTQDAAIKAIAEDLYGRRRAGLLGVSSDETEELGPDALAAAQGLGPTDLIALRPTFDADSGLVRPLSDLGLEARRLRMLSGDARVLLTAWLGSAMLDVQAILQSNPLPAPCHLLWVAGPDAARVRALVQGAGLGYSEPEIVADVLSGSPGRVHIGALYVASLRLRVDGLVEALVAAHRRGRADSNLLRAVVLALEFCPEDAAREFVTERLQHAQGVEREAAHAVGLRLALPGADKGEVRPTRNQTTRPRYSGAFARTP